MAKGKKKDILTPEERLQAALVPDWEQPYKVPENWCWVKLGTVCKFENGYAFKSKNFSESDGIPVVRISNIIDNGISLENCVYTTEENIDEKYIIKNGDILIAMSGATTGKNGIYYSDKIAYLNQRVGNIKVIDDNLINSLFRNFYIANVEKDILNLAYGGAQPNISSNKICDMNVPLPPPSEQQRIVGRVEGLFAKLDEANQKAQAALDSFETRKSAILHKAFTGELTARWRKESGVGMGSWKTQAFGLVTENLDAKRIPLSQEQRANMNRKYDYYGASGVIDRVEGYLFEGRYLLIGEDGANLVTRSKPIAFIADGQYWVNNHAHVLATVSYMNMDFLCYYINSIDLIPYVTGSAQPKLTQGKMNTIPIPVPSIREQEQIVSFLSKTFTKEQQAKEAAEAVIEQIDLIKKSILARAFRGELGTNDPAEENAVELVKQMIEKDDEVGVSIK